MINYKKILEQIATKLNFSDFNLEDYATVTITLEDGTLVYAATELDLAVQVFTDEALTTVLLDGDYVTVDNIKFTIADGVVGTIEKAEAEEPEVIESGSTVNAGKENLEFAGENGALLASTILTLFGETVDFTKNGYYSLSVNVYDGIAKATFYQDVDKSIVLAKLKLAEIVEEVKENKVKFTTSELIDGTKIYYDGELVVDVKVFTDEAMTTAVSNGEYTTILGEVLVITDGAVTEIKSVVDINAETIKGKDIEILDLTTQVAELTTKLAKAVENYEKVKVEFGKKAVTTSLRFNDNNEIVDTKSEINSNRVKTGQMFKQYFK